MKSLFPILFALFLLIGVVSAKHAPPDCDAVPTISASNAHVDVGKTVAEKPVFAPVYALQSVYLPVGDVCQTVTRPSGQIAKNYIDSKLKAKKHKQSKLPRDWISYQCEA